MSIARDALSSLDDATVDAAIRSASSRVDSYLTGRYRLPLALVGDDVKQAVADIAAWFALKARGFSPSGEDDPIRLGYLDAMSWLKDVAAGKAIPSQVDTVDANGVPNPNPPHVLSPAAGTGQGATPGSSNETRAYAGVIGTPKLRGW